MIELPAISKKLHELRHRARELYMKGFRKESIELMRVSRGDIKIRTGQTLFGLTAAEINAAKLCVTLERLLLAESEVIAERLPLLEDEVDDYVRKSTSNDPHWPKDRRKVSVC